MIGLAKLHNIEVAFRFNPKGDAENGYYDFKRLEKGTIKSLVKERMTASCMPVAYAGIFENEFEILPDYKFRIRRS